MMIQRNLAMACALAGALTPGVAAAEPLRDQFAYAAPIEVQAGAPLQWLELPLTVYRDAVAPGLADLRVLNGKGEVVPFALRRPPAEVPRQEVEMRLPLFPLRGDPAAATAAFSVRIEGDSLTVEGGQYVQGLDTPLVAVLIDARQVEGEIDSLTFASPDEVDYSLTALLEVSDDLVDWRTLSARVPLARLRHGGETFENRSVGVRPTRARFWRLRTASGDPLPGFDSVLATRALQRVSVDRQVLTAGGRANGAAGEFEFDLGANVPVDRLELELPDDNTVARVQYFARRAPGEAWRPVAGTGVYRLRTGSNELRSPPLPVPADASRYWRVVVDPRGGGLGAGVPNLRAGWLAHRVLFVARGAAPFELVYGNFVAENAEVALSELLPGWVVSDEATLAQPFARVGTARLAGGTERLTAPPPPGNWRLVLLWAALGLGVSSLAAVAWRLARQMRVGS